MAAQRIYIQVDAQTGGAEAAIKKLNNEITTTGKVSATSSQASEKSFKSFSVVVEDLERNMFGLGDAIASLGLVRLGVEMAQTADKINKIQIAFEGMLDSGERAAAMMDQLRNVAKTSPFAFEDLAESAQKLKAFGFEASKIPATIKNIANAAAALGGTKEKIDSITLALGQMYTKGTVQGQELYRQLGEQGIRAPEYLREAIEKEMGRPVSDQDVRKLVEKGMIAGQAGADAILKGMQEHLGNVGEKMGGLVTVHFQKLMDTLQQLSQVIMKDLAPALNSIMDKVQAFAQWFADLPEPVRKFIERIGELALAIMALGFAMKAIRGIGWLIAMPELAKVLQWVTMTVLKLGEAMSIAIYTGANGAKSIELLAAAFGETGLAGAIMLSVNALAVLTAAISGWLIGDKIIKWLTDVRERREAIAKQQGTPQESAGFYGGYIGGKSRLEDLLTWMTQEEYDLRKAQALQEHAVDTLLSQNNRLRQKVLTELGEKQAVKFPPLISTTDAKQDADALAKQNKAMLDALGSAADATNKELIRVNEELMQHLDDITKQALDHARAGLYGGVRAIQYEMAGIRREIDKAEQGLPLTGHEEDRAKLDQFRKTINTAEYIRTQHVLTEAREKSAAEAIQLNRQIEQERIAEMRKSADLEVALAADTSERTLEARSAAVTNGLYILQQREKEITIAGMKDALAAQGAEMDAWRAKGKREGVYDEGERRNIWTRGLLAIEKVQKDSAERVAKYRLDVEKQLLDSARQMNEQAYELQNQNQIEHAQHVGELLKAAVEVVPAQTEAAKTAQANAAAAAQIAALMHVKEVEDHLEQLRRDDKIRELMNLADLGWQAAQNAGKEYEAFDKLETAAHVKRQEDAQFEISKLQLEALKKHNEAVIEEQRKVYDSLKSAVGQVWDALLQHSKSVWATIGNLIKSTVLGALKEVVTSRAAAALTEMFGFGHVGFGGGRRGFLGSQPIFGGDKLVPVLADGTVPVTVTNAAPVNQQITQHFSATSPASTTVRDLMGAMGMVGGASVAGAAQPGGAYATSSSINGESTGAEVLQSFGGGGGAAGGATGSFGALTSTAKLASMIPGVGGSTAGSGLSMLGSLGGALGMAHSLGALKTLFGFGPATGRALTGAAGGPLAPGFFGSMSNFLHSPGAAGLGVAGSLLGLVGARKLGAMGGAGGLTAGALLGAGAGLLGFGSLMSLFPALAAIGPVGWIAAAGIGAVVGLSALFIKTADQKVRSKVKQVYGVDISEKNIRMQIVQIAQQRYGGNLDVAIRSPEVQEIVRMYAIATGKTAGNLPRPMYAATIAQSGGALNLQPVYQGGQLVSNPFTGLTTTQYNSPYATYLQLDPSQASALLTGQVVSIMNSNPGAVAAANAAGVASGNSRDAQAQSLLEPLTVLR